MAKDIRECLLEQARKFHQWQEITYPGKNTEFLCFFHVDTSRDLILE